MNNLIGQKIGNLLILDRKRENKRTYYYCKCSLCGNTKWIRQDYINKVKSCGCLSTETQFKSNNIKNERFGSLVALESTENRDSHGSVIWKCKCDCGNICFVSYKYLHSKVETPSCGCLSIESKLNNISKAKKFNAEKNLVEGTNIAAINRKKLLSNNTSGYTGVFWDKSREKWTAVITFKKKVYRLGRFENKEDAIKARKEAEEKLFGNFLEWYENEYKK